MCEGLEFSEFFRVSGLQLRFGTQIDPGLESEVRFGIQGVEYRFGIQTFGSRV